MNYLIIVLNRVYLILTKVQNQTPFFGAVTLVTILISFTFLNILGIYHLFKIQTMVINIPFFVLLTILIFILVFIYAKRNQHLIIDNDIQSPQRKSIFVAIVFIFTIMTTIYISNLNRDKISSYHNTGEYADAKAESLENRIRKWFK